MAHDSKTGREKVNLQHRGCFVLLHFCKAIQTPKVYYMGVVKLKERRIVVEEESVVTKIYGMWLAAL